MSATRNAMKLNECCRANRHRASLTSVKRRRSLARINLGQIRSDMRSAIATIVCIVMLGGHALLAYSASPEAKVFADQLSQLDETVNVLERRATEPDRAPQRALALREQIESTLVLVHGLGEAAERTNIDELKSGANADDISLLLVSRACEGLSFSLNALENYVATGDRIFLGLARDGEGLARSAEKGLP